ncbi:VOC family protein [Parasphingopyxis sp.]|uniref:VOC family protein n=1 Tax=Parasphingopyxis sp. TaxID=1920299 RepID=UPI002603B4A1|nr:VOC family protein [Parasphingopyxis sp.]
MTIRLHHIAIASPTPNATAAFYRETADLAPVDLPEDDDAQWLAGPNFYLALYEAKDGEPLPDRQVCDPGIGHFCLQSGDGNGLWQRLADGGMRFNDKPVALGTGAIYAYGRDRDATLIEVEGVPNADPETPIWFAHVAIVTPDIEALSGFYARLIGRDPHRTGRFDNPLFSNVTGMPDVDVSAAWIKTPSIQLEMWQYHHPPTGPASPPEKDTTGYRQVGFCCDDLDTERDRLESLGITFETGEDVAGQPTLWTLDPDGNRVAVLEISADAALALERLSDPDVVARRLAA